jgi:hypothetical protein
MSTRHYALLCWIAMTLAGAWEGYGAGVSCQQACVSGACDQAVCAWISAGGACSCISGAVRLGSGVDFAAYCGAWGAPGAACKSTLVLAPGMAANPGQATSAAPSSISMVTTLRSQNPYVAALMQALQQQGGWEIGSVQGLIHGAHYDTTTAKTSYDVGVPYAANVSAVSGAVTVNIVVQGDLTQLTRLQQYCATSAPNAVAPASVAGTIAQGGLHGSLQVTAASGTSQAIQW